MPRPGCKEGDNSLWNCFNWKDPSRIPLAENLCQGEDDVGVVCWGPPTFEGWEDIGKVRKDSFLIFFSILSVLCET